MRLRGLTVENLLSFDRFNLTFDQRQTVMVGPNGAGKTNVVRVLELVANALDWANERYTRSAVEQSAAAVLAAFGAAPFVSSPPDRPRLVRLDVELTTAEEKARLLAFVRAAVLSTLRNETARSGDSALLSGWLMESFGGDELRPLWTGTIGLEHPGIPRAGWSVYYEFELGGGHYRWLMPGMHQETGIVAAGPQDKPGRLQPERLLDRWTRVTDRTARVEQLPDPLPSIGLATLCPASGGIVELSLSLQERLDLEHEPYRDLARLLFVPQDVMPDRGVSTLAFPLARIFAESLVIVGEQFRGLGTMASPARPFGTYDFDELFQPQAKPGPRALPLRLFGLKNGTSVDRSTYERVGEAFAALAPGRSFDVTFEPTWIANGDARSSCAILTVIVTEAADAGEPLAVPVTATGAGVWEALVLAEALATTPDRVIVLDEPALNLHPSWQHLVRSLVDECRGQVLLVTHSPELVLMGREQDLTRLAYVRKDSGATQAFHSPASLDPDLAGRITREFHLSADARALLFARGAVLVEGETELGALPAWFAQAAAKAKVPAPEDLDLAFLSVHSETNFAPFVALLEALRVPWVLVCDGAGFDVTRSRDHIFRQLAIAGAGAPELQRFVDHPPSVMTEELFHGQVDAARRHGVLTLALGWKTGNKKTDYPGTESFEVFVESVAPGKLAEAKAEVDTSKPRVGMWLAEHVPCPGQVAQLYLDAVDGLRGRGLPLPPRPRRRAVTSGGNRVSPALH